jgi:hydroxypyruvate isomerase
VYDLSANIELLYSEAGESAVDRVYAAANDGFRLVEMWRSSNKDIGALRHALQATGTRLHAMCVEPVLQLVDPSTHEQFLQGVRHSVSVAETLECPILYFIVGAGLADRRRDHQRAALVDVLCRAADLLAGREVVLLVETLNSHEYKGTFLDRTREAAGIVREVGAPAIGLLYDAYHSLIMGEEPGDELAAAGDIVRHVQISDVPGRGEPGSGSVNWTQFLAKLSESGYTGAIGLEYVPTIDTTRSATRIREIVAQV